MSDTTLADQASAKTSDQASQTQDKATSTTDQGSGKDKATQDFERQIRELREESASWRTKLREAEGRLKEHDDAKLSDTEKLNKRIADAETQAKQAAADLLNARVRMEIERQARRLNIIDEEAAFRLLDGDAIEFDDKKMPKNVERLLSDLVKSKPYLVGEAGTSAAQPNRGRGGNGYSIEAIKGMTAQQIAALPEAEYKKVLAAAGGR